MTTLYQALETTCRRHPQRIALVDHHSGRQVTYAQLLAMVHATICRMQHCCPLSPGDRAGLLMANTLAFVVGFFAVEALGGVVIPLNTRLTPKEHLAVVEDAGAAGVLMGAEFQDALAVFQQTLSWVVVAGAGQDEPLLPGGAVYGMDPWLETPEGELPQNLPDVSGGQLAVLVYTSGTTGRSKGVMLSHRNLLADAQANAQVIEATAGDVFVTTSPLFHVFGLANVMLTGLLTGARVVLVRKFNPKTVLEAITHHRVTFLAAVPTMYQMMLSLLPSPDYDLQTLRVCHSGAAPMPEAVFAQVESLFGAPVQEGYGQSEASSIVTSNPLRGVRKPGSIGLPLPGLEIEIVDESGAVRPPGQVGELRLKGETVMLGYWNNPQATAKAIRDGWLYTGDMGYRDADGYIFLVGRRDDMINVGGAKVYPREVEEVLYQHPAVAACAVTGEASALYHQVVSAYVVKAPDAQVCQADLQRFCRTWLAEYKVPKTVYFVDSIPQGATGKILRHRLCPPDPASGETVSR